MLKRDDEAPAVPLWIDGHAYLTVPPAFFDVRAAGGETLRRTPLCGAAELARALAGARAAQPSWQHEGAAGRTRRVAALAVALAAYAEHFARLVAEESGSALAPATDEVERTVALLAAAPTLAAPPAPVPALVAVVADAPLYAPLAHAVPALLGGAAVLVRPAPQTPSPLFAFAELTGRCAFPGGVFSIVHGDAAMVAALEEARARRAIAAVYNSSP